MIFWYRPPSLNFRSPDQSQKTEMGRIVKNVTPQMNRKLSWLWLVSILASGTLLYSQHRHDMGNMPGMNMSKTKPKSKTAPKRTRRVRRKKHSRKQRMGNMPGMKMPGTQTPKPSPSASPQMQMNMPGMQMPSASPSASPRHEMMP